MKVSTSGLRQDSPARPLLLGLFSYQGITDQLGNAFGTTLQDTLCSTAGLQPSYAGQVIKLNSSDAAGQVRTIAIHAIATGIITVADPFTDFNGAAYQIPAGTLFVILSSVGGGGAPAPVLAPSIGLWMFGECDPAMAASTTVLVIPNLAGFPDDVFNNEFWIQVIHNDDAVGTAPEREIHRVTDYVGATGTFTTDAFTANVEANDLIVVFHESIMAIEVLGFGTLSTSSATVPADAARPGTYAWEVDNYFNGCLLMTTEGAARFAPRRIVDYTNATGVFTLDPNNPFPAAPGVVDYIIIGGQTEFVPGADGANNTTPSDVVGNKTSTAIYVKDDVSDIIRYLKALLDAGITASGTADAGSTVGFVRDAARTEANDWWNGQTLLMLTGAAAFQKRPIVDFLAATDDIVVSPDFDAAPGAGDVYIILAHYNEIVPRAADSTLNVLTSQVIGRKDDTAIVVPDDVSSIIRYLKGILTAAAATFQEQADVAVSINAINASETDVFDLNVADTRYIVHNLRLKCADPGANTVTVRLYELVNDASLEVDSFEITTANFGTTHSLMDMFGMPHLSGDDLQVTVRASAGGPFVVTGQYSHGLAT